MQAVKSENTAIEWQVRRWLHAHGYRYRLHGRGLPGHPDLVFSRRMKVVFIHGCFWHGHTCARGRRVPKTNTDYWKAKIARNVTRDTAALRFLEELGWQSAVVWECELQKEPGAVMAKLSGFLGNGHAEPDRRIAAVGE